MNNNVMPPAGPITNWHVLTGGPGSGKTTLLAALSACGYYTLVEGARFVADWGRAPGQSFTVYDAEFQQRVNELNLRREQTLDPAALIFMDRAVPDTIAYCHLHGFDPSQPLARARRGPRYRRVFLLEAGPYQNDSVRIETEAEAAQIAVALTAAYRDLGYDPIVVPWAPLAERLALVLTHLGDLRRDRTGFPTCSVPCDQRPPDRFGYARTD